MKNLSILTVALGVAVVLAGPTAQAQDGASVFNRCKACHSLKAGQNKVGPSLHGVVGRPAGTVEGFRYTDLNQQAGDLGLVWTKENIVAYLPDPQAFLQNFIEENGGDPKGRTRMTYRLRDADDAEAVVEYLASQ